VFAKFPCPKFAAKRTSKSAKQWAICLPKIKQDQQVRLDVGNQPNSSAAGFAG